MYFVTIYKNPFYFIHVFKKSLTALPFLSAYNLKPTLSVGILKVTKNGAWLYLPDKKGINRFD